MPRLRRVSPSSVGWTRRRSGKGFRYLDDTGRALTAADVTRIKGLVIPPAWREVWICPDEYGHIQAVGYDDAGRKQYLYHPMWRERRDRLKYRRVVEIAERLPRIRTALTKDLSLGDDGRDQASALAVRLLDRGYFRIGSDVYADENGSFGLTTLQRRHLRRDKDVWRFEFTGKSGVEHAVEIADPSLDETLMKLRRRRGGSERLLVWRDGRRWRELGAADVNEYLGRIAGVEMTAKDFRTWHATVLAATALALTEEPGETAASRKRAVRAAIKEVSGYLGNTVAVARASYVDPRIIEHYEDGRTIVEVARRRHRSPERRQTDLERAVRELLG